LAARGQKFSPSNSQNFFLRAASETPPSCSLEQSRAEKLPYHLSFIFVRTNFFLKGEAIFLRGSAA